MLDVVLFFHLGTCKCYENLFGNWYIYPPYVTQLLPGDLSVMFTELIHEMIIKACDGCKLYRQSKLYLDLSKSGASSNRRNSYELKISIADDVDVSFPYYERSSFEAVMPDSVYLTILESPGCAFIVRNVIDVKAITITLIKNVLQVRRLLLVSYCIAMLFGILIWFTVNLITRFSFENFRCIFYWFIGLPWFYMIYNET